MNKTLLILALSGIFLTGCATTPSASSSQGMSARVSAFTKKINDKSAVFVVVPSANNAISNGMMVASIKGGADTAPVMQLVSMLKNPNSKPIAVTSDSDAIAAATIESAISKLNGYKPAAKVYYVGDASYGADLKATADAAGVKLEVVPYP